MGNTFGYYLDNGFNRFLHPETQPGYLEEPTFDPNVGFPNGRKPREMIATEEEMRSAKIPIENRDYCAHKLLLYWSCRKDHWPFVVQCEHEKHSYLNCQYEDLVLRMKEYEREKRLRVRAQKQEVLAA